jgi:hypothetical protein
VDTKKHFYFWVEQTATLDENAEFLVGHDFDGGLGTATCAGVDMPLWVVSESGVTAFRGRVALEHRQRLGHRLRLLDGVVPSFPFLLTSDPNARQVYHGPATITAANLPTPLEQAVGHGMPLRGKNWLGVVRTSTNDGIIIDVYSDERSTSLEECDAYCPWWASDIGDDEGQFLLSVLRPASF